MIGKIDNEKLTQIVEGLVGEMKQCQAKPEPHGNDCQACQLVVQFQKLDIFTVSVKRVWIASTLLGEEAIWAHCLLSFAAGYRYAQTEAMEQSVLNTLEES